jgi:hypothetical protein
MGLVEPVLQKSVALQFDAELMGQVLKSFAGRIQAHRQDHHVEFFFLDAVLGGRIPNGDVLGYRILFDDGGVASDESDPFQFLGPLVVSFEILAEGPNIVMEDGAFGLRVMILG